LACISCFYFWYFGGAVCYSKGRKMHGIDYYINRTVTSNFRG
jgi:hypothetical protein